MATKKTATKGATDTKKAAPAKAIEKKAEKKVAEKPVEKKNSKKAPVEISHHEIAERAAYICATNPQGDDTANWLLAERQLREERS